MRLQYKRMSMRERSSRDSIVTTARSSASSASHRLLQLQRQIGNRALLSMLRKQPLRSQPNPANSSAGDFTVQRDISYVDTTKFDHPDQWEKQSVNNWSELTQLFPSLLQFPALDDIVFQYDITIVRGLKDYILNIADKGWTYNHIPLAAVYHYLKRLENLALNKEKVVLERGTSLVDPIGIGLSVDHAVYNADGKKFSGQYKVTESIHKRDEPEHDHYQLTVDAFNEFNDLHHIPHDLDYVFEGKKTVHQLWLDHDRQGQPITYSGFEIVREIEKIKEGVYYVKIEKKPKQVTIKGITVEAGVGSASAMFKMRWNGTSFEFI